MLYTSLRFVLDIYLGVTDNERMTLQSVEVSFEFQNDKSIKCTNDDNETDYVCYQKITDSIYRRFNETEVRLLEYLCYQIYQIIKSQVADGILVNVFVKKKCTDIIKGKDGEATCRYVEFLGSL